jgi:hypothetical protein
MQVPLRMHPIDALVYVFLLLFSTLKAQKKSNYIVAGPFIDFLRLSTETFTDQINLTPLHNTWAIGEYVYASEIPPHEAVLEENLRLLYRHRNVARICGEMNPMKTALIGSVNSTLTTFAFQKLC